MGLSRFASRRHPHVVVMAPALTESGQTQSFTDLPNLLNACEFQIPKPKKKNQEVGIAVYNLDGKTQNGKRASPLRPLDIAPSGWDSSMNFGSPMGDQPENMGHLKSESIIKEPVDDLAFIKENDMDQYLEQLAPNVDELMQAITTMDSEGQDNVEFPLSNAELASFEKELLFNQEDPISTFADDTAGPDPRIATFEKKEDEVVRTVLNIEKRHFELMNRIKKLEARQVGKETAASVTAVLEHAYQLAVPEADPALKPTRADLDKFTEKLHGAAHSLAQTATRFRPGIRYFGSGSVEPPQSVDPPPGSVVPKLDAVDRESLNAVASQLSTQLGIADAQCDSDATDSSSGGDSCDETVNYNNHLHNLLST